MSHEVFISHSVEEKDEEAANTIHDYLENNGIKCFMDKRNLIPGMPYPVQLTKAIRRSRVVVLVLSANSDNSENVLNEVSLARANKLRIIPVRIEAIAPEGLAFFLTSTQWLDAFPQHIQAYLSKILVAVRRNLEEGISTKADIPLDYISEPSKTHIASTKHVRRYNRNKSSKFVGNEFDLHPQEQSPNKLETQRLAFNWHKIVMTSLLIFWIICLVISFFMAMSGPLESTGYQFPAVLGAVTLLI